MIYTEVLFEENSVALMDIDMLRYLKFEFYCYEFKVKLFVLNCLLVCLHTFFVCLIFLFEQFDIYTEVLFEGNSAALYGY